jgi:photosystem II stability/assembly factor-like uncharacterized protein
MYDRISRANTKVPLGRLSSGEWVGLNVKDAIHDQTDAGNAGDESSATIKKRRGLVAPRLLAIVFWLEAAWAAAFLGWTLAYWAGLPATYAAVLFGVQRSAYRLVRTTDVPRLIFYLGFLALLVIVLSFAGFAVWRLRSDSKQTFGLKLARGALWSQPLLIVLVIESAMAVGFGSAFASLVLPPSFPIVVLIATVVAVGVFTIVLEGKLPSTRRLTSLAAAVVVSAIALAPLFLVDGYFGSERSFSAFGVLPTGRSLVVAAVDCPSPTHCVAEGSNLVPFQLPLRYVAVAGLIGSNSRWRTAWLPQLALGKAAKSEGVQVFGSNGTTSIACPTSNVCLAVGFMSLSPPNRLSLPIWRSDNGGENWVLTPVPLAGGPGIVRRSLACLNELACVAVNGGTIIATRDGGTDWKTVARLSVPPQFPNFAGVVACPTSRECIAVLSGVETLNGSARKVRWPTVLTWTNDGGRTWVSHRVAALRALPQAFACWSSTNCLMSGNPVDPLASGPSLYLTTDRGLRWNRLRVPGGSNGMGLIQIQCVAPRECYAATGNSVIKTTDGGETWTTTLTVTAPTVVSVLSCATAQNCVAGGTANWPSGQSAALWTTQNGGTTWTVQPFPTMPVPRGLRPCAAFATVCASGS